MNTEAIALTFLDQGIRPLPIVPDTKVPYVKEWKPFQKRPPTKAEVGHWFATWPDANLAILTGAASGVDVVDFDIGHDPWPTDGHELPKDCVVSTPSGGTHYYIKHVDGLRCRHGTLAKGVDLLADGGYVLVPPSTVGGNAYTYTTGRITDAKPAPEWLREALLTKGQKARSGAKRGTAREWFEEGTRNVSLTAIAGAMRGQGLSEAAICRGLLALTAALCQPPLDKADIESIAASVSRYPVHKSRGFWKLPQDDIDALLQCRDFGGLEDFRVYFALAAQTLGFGRSADIVSAGQLKKRTGYPSRGKIHEALRRLESTELVGREHLDKFTVRRWVNWPKKVESEVK